MYAIINANRLQWGRNEFYASKEAADSELREFFKGIKVDFKKFEIVPVPVYFVVDRL